MSRRRQGILIVSSIRSNITANASQVIALLFLMMLSLFFVTACTTSSQIANSFNSNEISSDVSNSQASESLQPAQKIYDYSTGPSSQTKNLGKDPQDSNGAKGGLIVRFIDVGQGDCALISCEDAHMLIDGGPPEASSKVYAILQRLNIDHLDYIVASHPDADHIGGISGALNYASCDTCYCSTTENDTESFASLKRYLAKQGKDIAVPRSGECIALNEASVTFVGPVSTLDGTNNNSLVCRIDYGETSFLFTGDAELEEELLLVAANANLSADVLKVAHHGSASSTSLTFLNEVNPSYAVVSVGSYNTYGHPAGETLERLAMHNATILRTDEAGSIIFHSDGSSLTFQATEGTIDE